MDFLQRISLSAAMLLAVLVGLPLSTADNRCSLVVDTISVQLALDPAAYCGHSSVVINGIVLSKCSNSGDDCENYHYPDSSPEEQFCIAKTSTLVSGTHTVYGGGGCEQTVNYEFANITSCECEYIHSPAGSSYHVTVS